MNCWLLPSRRPPRAASFDTAFDAKTPVNNAPRVPPTPCTPKASSESSYRNFALIVVQAKKQTIPAASPITIPDSGVTKPHAGVMQTSPATAPEHAPRMLGLPRVTHSAPAQASTPADVARCVARNALPANSFAPAALPPLEPKQPTHHI